MKENTIRHAVKTFMARRPLSKLENREVKDGAEMSRRQVNSALSDLARKGYLKRVKRGIYRHNEPEQMPLFAEKGEGKKHAGI